MAATEALSVTSHCCSDDVAADGLHALDRLGGAVEIAVDRENLGAFLGKAHAGGAPVAPAGADAAGAGDDGDAALQTSAHGFASILRLPLGGDGRPSLPKR